MENSVSDFSGKDVRQDVRTVLDSYSNSINEYVHFGSQLIDWDLNREVAEKKDGYVVPILFLRNLIESSDGISILIRHGASDPAKSLLRTVLENFFSLEYLLESVDERSMYFHAWNTFQQMKLYEKLDGHSDRAKQLSALLSKDKYMRPASPMVHEPVEKWKAIAKELLALDHYKDVVAEYERTAARIKNPQWYSLYDGPVSVEALAGHLKLFGLYELYRSLSNSVHGTDIAHDKLSGLGDGRIGVLQLRYPKNAHMITGFVHDVCLAAFMSYVKIRLPEKKREFNEWAALTEPFRERMAKGEFMNFHD